VVEKDGVSTYFRNLVQFGRGAANASVEVQTFGSQPHLKIIVNLAA